MGRGEEGGSRAAQIGRMAAAFIQAKKNAQRNFKQAITAQEDGMEQYRHDNFQKATSFRRPLQPPPRTDTNLSDENDPHAAGCEKSAVGEASSRDVLAQALNNSHHPTVANMLSHISNRPPLTSFCSCRQPAVEEALLRIPKVRLLQLQQTRGSVRC